MISLVIPCFNEAEVLPLSIPVIVENLSLLKDEYEILAVDDGSTDNTLQVLQELRVKYPIIRIIKLRGNFGHTAALHAGIKEANGEWCFTMDCDLQDPPELLPKMYEEALEHKVCLVNTTRVSRKSDTYFKRMTANIFYKLISRLSGVPIIPNSADYRLMHKCLRVRLTTLNEVNPVLRMIIPSLGYQSRTVTFIRPDRAAGKTKYSLRKMILLAVNSVFTFGIRPLRFILLTGSILGVFSFTAALLEFIVWLRGWAIPGITTIVLPMLLLNSFLLVAVGLLGEYVGVAINEIRNRPSFVIDECNQTGQVVQ